MSKRWPRPAEVDVTRDGITRTVSAVGNPVSGVTYWTYAVQEDGARSPFARGVTYTRWGARSAARSITRRIRRNRRR